MRQSIQLEIRNRSDYIHFHSSLIVSSRLYYLKFVIAEIVIVNTNAEISLGNRLRYDANQDLQIYPAFEEEKAKENMPAADQKKTVF